MAKAPSQRNKELREEYKRGGRGRRVILFSREGGYREAKRRRQLAGYRLLGLRGKKKP